jgi:hypothetical protein
MGGTKITGIILNLVEFFVVFWTTAVFRINDLFFSGLFLIFSAVSASPREIAFFMCLVIINKQNDRAMFFSFCKLIHV